LETKEKRILELEKWMEDAHFWENQNRAQQTITEANQLKSWTIPYHDINQSFDAVESILPEAQEMGDQKLVEELLEELNKIELNLSKLEARRMLSGEMDGKNCFLSINSGAGGTEACDWAWMLARMYQRWAEQKGWNVEILDQVEGEVAGIKSITFKFTGPYAYGYAKAEKGVHRLVRISPFDSSNRRHTSFASVDVSPEITDDIEIEIKPNEIRIDTFRSSGAGGQHVNVTDSAVRITHLPTNIVVSCQRERSQTQNRETCLKMLKSKLYELEILERQQNLSAIGGEKKEIAFGSQIRNYVFHPYTLVKDTRTGYETGNIAAMMDGEILDDFIVAHLKEFG
jgi:peptide chain release factor 2